MSRFLSKSYSNVTPYVPGEQPKGCRYIKLNANETSLPPSPAVVRALSKALVSGLGRYEDPYCTELRKAIAASCGVTAAQIFVGNGSDEVLGFLCKTFFDHDSRVCFPDITYGFYKVYCETFGVNYQEIPLENDFTVNVQAYANSDRHVILANPNAPTGLRLSIEQIETIVKANPDRLVVIDEAYVDYGNPTCIPLLKHYDNLIVVQTFSKSRNLAGARIGFAVASEKLITEMRDIKFAVSPFNLSEMALAAGTAAVRDTDYLHRCVQQTISTRNHVATELERLGFFVFESHTNFIFVRHPVLQAEEYYRILKKNGILTRWYNENRIRDFLRITVGTPTEMAEVLRVTRQILARKTA